MSSYVENMMQQQGHHHPSKATFKILYPSLTSTFNHHCELYYLNWSSITHIIDNNSALVSLVMIKYPVWGTVHVDFMWEIQTHLHPDDQNPGYWENQNLMFHVNATSLKDQTQDTNEYNMNICQCCVLFWKHFVYYMYCLAVLIVCLSEAKISCPS